MKKLLLTTLMFLFLINSVAFAAVSVSRDMPTRVDPNGLLQVKLTVTTTESLSGFDIAEFIPKDWTIKEWSTLGIDKNYVSLESPLQKTWKNEVYKAYHWKVNKAIDNSITILYLIDVPVSSGSYKFASVWTYLGGFSSDEKSLNVEFSVPPTPPQCGNNLCESGENCSTCEDCACKEGMKCKDNTCVEALGVRTNLTYYVVVIVILGILAVVLVFFFKRKIVHSCIKCGREFKSRYLAEEHKATHHKEEHEKKAEEKEEEKREWTGSHHIKKELEELEGKLKHLGSKKKNK